MTMNRRQLLAALATSAWIAPARAQHASQAWPAARAVPPLVASDLQGRRWDLSALRGQPVLLNFWATWCAPCKQEMPSLQALAARQPELQVLAINVRERAPRVRRYLQASGLQLTVLLDPFGEVTDAWDVRVFPTSVLIAADGRPSRSVTGAVDWAGAGAQRWLRALAA